MKHGIRQLNTRLLGFVLALGLLLLLAAAAPARAFAAAPVETDRPVKLTVLLSYEELALPGGELSVYRVGDLSADAELTLTEPFAARFDLSGKSTRSDWTALAEAMKRFCADEKLSPTAKGTTDDEGKAVFDAEKGIGQGLYLIVVDDLEYRGVRYHSLPFLITLPCWNERDQAWDYEVEASPKIELETAPTPSPTPSPTPTPAPTPTPPPDILPQTGMLWWPVPALLGVFALLLALGIVLRKKPSATALLILGGLCALGAFGLTVNNLLADARAEVSVAAERERLLPVIEELTAEKEEAGPSLPTLPEPEPEAEEEEAPQPYREMTVRTVDGVDYVAMLSIPDLNLELPIRSDWDYNALNRSPCRYAGSAYMDDLVLCAHNFSQHFGRLNDLEEGSEVLLVDMEGNLFRYVVARQEILAPTAVREMTDSEYGLTLFTCTLGGRSRVTVRCARVE